MQVERRRLSRTVERTKRLFGHLIGIDPKISAARDRHRNARQLERGDRKFHELKAVSLDLIRKARSIGDAIAIVEHGKYTRIELDAKLAQNIERPQRFFCDGKEWGAMAEYFLACKILEKADRTHHFLSEDLRFLRVDQCARKPVRANFVSCGLNAFDQLGMLFRHISEHKERRPSSCVVEDVEKLFANRLDAVLELVPFGIRYLEALIPVLEIDR